MLSVSVIYVSFNRCEQMRQFHEQNARTAGRSYDELIWVDNGSSDGTAEYAARLSTDKLILNRFNLGFERAANLAFAASSCDWLILVCTNFGPPNWLKIMCDIAETGEVDLVSIYSGEWRNRWGPQHERWLKGEHRTLANHVCCPAIPMEFILFHRSVIERIGYFREDFSYGWSDVEWAYRAANRRLRTYVIEDLSVSRLAPPAMQVVEPNGEVLDYNEAKVRRINATRDNQLLAWCCHNCWPYYNPFNGSPVHPFGTVEKFQAGKRINVLK